ncbi:cadherin-24-like [Protopterus annectens]|uniref:cadherin-24-like n=1 Tax=Protopterus annectens TaxID=7888 RepID=UPI001CFBC21F|nr:cadherin-24-like [Protopterus annectens]XP_043913739.1 cadherin-24-like [Protopterus annectens]XP_043913740.1 cadherin-24-like [Protopterus annectens]
MKDLLQVLLACIYGCYLGHATLIVQVPLQMMPSPPPVPQGSSQGLERSLLRTRRSWVWNQFFVIEGYSGPEPVLIGRLHTDMDKGENKIKYILTGEGAGTVFVIDEKTGNIHVTKTLDREEKPQYTLLAQAVDRQTNRPLEPPSEFIIKVQDINDNPPMFLHGPYHATVPEMSNVGTSVIQVTASDADDPTYGNSARLVYTVLEGQPFFSVDPQTGIIRTAIPNMDRETQDEFLVVIQAKDMGGHMGGLSGTTTVTVTLLDVNDNPPKFPQSLYQFSVPESITPGSLVGRLKAQDPDIGENAMMSYNILDGEGADIFNITTDHQGQEGMIILKKSLDFESQRSYSFRVEATNTFIDPHYIRKGPFKDVTTVKVEVMDADEVPVFSQPSYNMVVYENSAVGTIVGRVSAWDPDSHSSIIRYSINQHTDPERYFTISPQNGTIFTAMTLDRETVMWHNITVIATEIDSPSQASRALVAIQTLDMNDNAPQFKEPYEAFICDNARPGQLILTIGAVDPDEMSNNSRFSYRVPPDYSTDRNFTIKDNQDNSASVLVQQNKFAQNRRDIYLVPIVISDGGTPPLSSTNTLTISICRCGLDGTIQSCNMEAYISPAGLSTGALVAILACIATLLAIVVLFVALRKQKKEALIVYEEEDVRENIITYDDEGGGEEDTEAFDITALQNPNAAIGPGMAGGFFTAAVATARRDVKPKRSPAVRRSNLLANNTLGVEEFLKLRLYEVDEDPSVPPYDSIQIYGYEGQGSSVGSLSSLDSSTTDTDVSYEHLEDWGPRFHKLADLYGAKDTSCYP